MIGSPLPGRGSTAVLSALLSHGWEGASCLATASGLEPWAHHFTHLTADQVEALMSTAPRFGLDLVTGENWALLSGTQSRLSAFARSWQLPPELGELAIALGTGLPAEAAASWRTAGGVIDLSQPVVMDRLPPGIRSIAASEARDSRNSSRKEGEPGILIVAQDPANAVVELEQALDIFLTAGLDPEQIALDPAWEPGRPSLALHRRFGRPLLCSTDDPVIAVLARQQGAQLFRSADPETISRALELEARHNSSHDSCS